MSFVVPAQYGWVLFTAVVIGFHCLITGFGVGGVRRKYFNKEFFSKHFPELKSPPKLGYPDMGNGKFADKLTLEQWMDFNNSQRAHYNYVEGVASILIALLVSGLSYPALTTYLGLQYVAGRQAYAMGYRRNGARGRGLGVLLLDTALVALMIAALISAWNIGGGHKGFLALFGF